MVGIEDEILCIMFQELGYLGGNAHETIGSFIKRFKKNRSERHSLKVLIENIAKIGYKNGREWKRACREIVPLSSHSTCLSTPPIPLPQILPQCTNP